MTDDRYEAGVEFLDWLDDTIADLADTPERQMWSHARDHVIIALHAGPGQPEFEANMCATSLIIRRFMHSIALSN